MRMVMKGPAPLNVSPKGQTPMRFVEAEKELIRLLEAFVPVVAEKEREERTILARGRFDAMNKRVIRDALIAEQHGLCVYCEDRVREPEHGTPPPIEHWRPLSLSHHTAIHWRNLYQSCDRVACCDDRKDNVALAANDDEYLPWPCEFAYEEVIGVSRSGDLFVRTDGRLSREQREMLTAALGRSTEDRELGDADATLNLNHPVLREARLAAIEAERERLARKSPGRVVPAADREARAAELLAEKTRMPFISARVAWLRRQLGQ